jgi:hypothetical protein
MNITVTLVNLLGDEIGDIGLDALRVASAGTETATPNLAGQMSQLIDRLNGALADLSLVPVLAPMAVRIAASRALLEPTPRGIVIPLQVRPADGGEARDVMQDGLRGTAPQGITSQGVTSGAAPGAAVTSGPAAGGEWADLFVLGPDEEAGPAGRDAVPPFGRNGEIAHGGRNAAGADPDLWGNPDGWEALPDEGLMDEGLADEGGWR